MTGWRLGLAAFFAWAVHFFVAYGIMLAFPEAHSLGWITLGLGLACLAFLAWVVRSRPPNRIVLFAAVLSALAITWQSMVGLF